MGLKTDINEGGRCNIIILQTVMEKVPRASLLIMPLPRSPKVMNAFLTKMLAGISFLVVLMPWYAQGQYKLSGVVRDSVQHVPVPGAEVSVNSQQRSTTTNGAGEFEIDSRTPSADVTFSFIGYKTVTRKVVTGNRVVIDMPNDPELEKYNAYIKTSVNLGYLGDPNYAPFGFILTHHLQSIGKATLGINSVFKYWQGGTNYGFEGSVNKELSGSIRRVVDNVFMGYKTINYPEDVFRLKHTRVMVSRAIERYFFSIDAGVAYNEVFTADEQGLITQKYVSGSLGLTKVIGWFRSPALSGWGFQSSVNYHPDRTMFEVGTFKGFSGRKLPSMVLMIKYYNYQEIDGWMLSLRFGLFSNEYYCCYSYRAHATQIAAFR